MVGGVLGHTPLIEDAPAIDANGDHAEDHDDGKREEDEGDATPGPLEVSRGSIPNPWEATAIQTGHGQASSLKLAAVTSTDRVTVGPNIASAGGLMTGSSYAVRTSTVPGAGVLRHMVSTVAPRTGSLFELVLTRVLTAASAAVSLGKLLYS
jgi:hypothetical protein